MFKNIEKIQKKKFEQNVANPTYRKSSTSAYLHILLYSLNNRKIVVKHIFNNIKHLKNNPSNPKMEKQFLFIPKVK